MGETLLFVAGQVEHSPDAPTMLWVFQGVLALAVTLIGWLANRAVGALDKEMDIQRAKCAGCADRITALQIASAGSVTKGDLDALRSEIREDLKAMKDDILQRLGR
jgi:hypothetical protein